MVKIIPDALKIMLSRRTALEEIIFLRIDECHSLFSSSSPSSVNWNYVDRLFSLLSQDLRSYNGRFSEYFRKNFDQLKREEKEFLGYLGNIE